MALGRENGFRVFLSNSSMAVNTSSPREVKDFYGSVFINIDDLIARNAAHNKMVKELAEAADVPFIDTTPDLDGVWDRDLFVDLVHFTEKGNQRIAQVMFDGVAPTLRSDPSLRCVAR
jgi:hypothetical protein